MSFEIMIMRAIHIAYLRGKGSVKNRLDGEVSVVNLQPFCTSCEQLWKLLTPATRRNCKSLTEIHLNNLFTLEEF